jgi:hypothetical protein
MRQTMIENGMNMRTSDFINLYEKNLSPRTSNKKAYEQAESEHKKLTGHTRYSDYESFRSVKNKRVKSQKRK